jgi:HlyD family secretion protein
VVTYDAVIDVDNGDLKLRPGMTANVTFVYAQKEAVLRIPNVALRFRPTPEMMGGGKTPGGRPSGGGGRRNSDDQTDRHQVWAIEAGEPKPMAVRVGITDGTVTEMVEGDLREGQPLITDVISKEPRPSGGGSAPGASGGRRGPF